jgi:hypothetical protein
VTAGARVPKYKGFAATRPPDIAEDSWQAALRGLQAFVAGGWAEKAEALGWSRDELYRAPELWVRADLCGAALLIGANEVIAVTPTEIRIKTPSGLTQGIYRRPAVDYVVMFDSRLNQLVGSVGSGEARLRAREWTVREYQRLNNVDLEGSKRAVDSILAEKGNRP